MIIEEPIKFDNLTVIEKLDYLKNDVDFLLDEHQSSIRCECSKSDYKLWALSMTIIAGLFATLFIIEKFF